MPLPIRYAALVVSGDTRDIIAQRERELHLAVYDLHGNEVVFLVVSSIVEEKTVSLSCRKPEINVHVSIVIYFPVQFKKNAKHLVTLEGKVVGKRSRGNPK